MMHTSGLVAAIHSRSGGSLAKNGAQYGSSVRPLSIATPTAGMCDVPTAPTSSAIARPLALCVTAVAFDAAPAGEHHLDVVLFGDAGLLGGELLERHAIARRQLERVVDVPAQLEHPQPLTVQDRVPLLGAHRELVEVTRFVGAER